MTERVTKYKLAVIIGENCRNSIQNMVNIECFLKLFDTDYDIYACVDNPGKLAGYKNVVSSIPYHTVSNTPEIKKMSTTCGNYMKGAGWQFIKCNIAIKSIAAPTQYTHMMKLRTDCVFRFAEMFHRMFPHHTSIEQWHVNEMKKMFKKYLEAIYENGSMNIIGDKIALGEFSAAKNWLENFIEPKYLQKMYATPPFGPDYIAGCKAWWYNKVPTTIQKPIQYGPGLWDPLVWFHLTWFTDANNTVRSVAQKKNGDPNLSVGIRGSAVKIPRPIDHWKSVMGVTKHIASLL